MLLKKVFSIVLRSVSPTSFNLVIKSIGKFTLTDCVSIYILKTIKKIADLQLPE